MAAIAQALQGEGKKALLLGGRALRAPALMALARIAAQTGATLFAEVFPTRLERGAGLPPVERIAYLAELASVQLAGLDHLILVDERKMADVSQERQRMAARQALRERKAEEAAQDWLRQLRDRAYVEYRTEEK